MSVQCLCTFVGIYQDGSSSQVNNLISQHLLEWPSHLGNWGPALCRVWRSANSSIPTCCFDNTAGSVLAMPVGVCEKRTSLADISYCISVDPALSAELDVNVAAMLDVAKWSGWVELSHSFAVWSFSNSFSRPFLRLFKIQCEKQCSNALYIFYFFLVSIASFSKPDLFLSKHPALPLMKTLNSVVDVHEGSRGKSIRRFALEHSTHEGFVSVFQIYSRMGGINFAQFVTVLKLSLLSCIHLQGRSAISKI